MTHFAFRNSLPPCQTLPTPGPLFFVAFSAWSPLGPQLTSLTSPKPLLRCEAPLSKVAAHHHTSHILPLLLWLIFLLSTHHLVCYQILSVLLYIAYRKCHEDRGLHLVVHGCVPSLEQFLPKFMQVLKKNGTS